MNPNASIMSHIKFVVNSLVIVACAIFLSSTSFAEPRNLAQLTDEVKAYHDSGKYQKELAHVVDQARYFIIERVHANQKKEAPEKLAIVLDIDETSLSNYKNMVARHFIATEEALHREIQAANAPAIKPMLSLYQQAKEHNIAIFFVTGRREAYREPTYKNLKRVGFNEWSGLYFKPNNYNQPSVIPFKTNARAKINELGYTIIASIGDQFSDLNGGYAEKTFKLPNPYYYLP